MKSKTSTIYEIDAAGKRLGRIATEAANVLMGKHSATYTRNILPQFKVHIINAHKVIFSPKKLAEEYTTYTGHPGGLTKETRKLLIERRGNTEMFRRTIYGMLPPNKLRKQIMKNLTISD